MPLKRWTYFYDGVPCDDSISRKGVMMTSVPEQIELLEETNGNLRYDPSQEYVPRFDKDVNKCIDFVLAYQEEDSDSEDENDLDEDDNEKSKRVAKAKGKQRARYLNQLRQNGIDIEEAKFTRDGCRVWVWKLHGQFEALCNCAEDRKMKKEIGGDNKPVKSFLEEKAPYLLQWFNRIDPFVIQGAACKAGEFEYQVTFDKRQMKIFKNYDDEINFFSHSERTRLVHYICSATDPKSGLEDLIHEGIFTAAFPLHQGSLLKNDKNTPSNPRQQLQHDWACWSSTFKYQPILAIKNYFGEKIGLYFCWLGFYTTFLIPAAIVGVLCFLYGVATAFSFTPVQETCHPKDEKLVYHCPLCDKHCSYFLLSKTSCLYAKVTRFFDNEGTLTFAIFMSLWATFFLEFWKRKQATLACEWHTRNYEETEEKMRPQYVHNATSSRLNKANLKDEPYIPWRKRAPRIAGVIGVVAFFGCLVIASLVGVIIYRATLFAFLFAKGNKMGQSTARIVVAGTAATINLLVLVVLRYFYFRLAKRLTSWEQPRTYTDYEDSFTIKMFWFEFVNTYSSIFYVAFFKSSQFVGIPGRYKRVGGEHYRLEGCPAEGCFLELCIQVIVIMLGQQILGTLSELLLPYLKKWYTKRSVEGNYESLPQWEKDYDLEPREDLALFWEYLEMVLQYCFVTMFVAAFPLAPLFALINNVLEIRTDAINFLRYFRRPVPLRAEDIGAWYSILATLTEFSVLVNALVIAFSSDLIPRIVYAGMYSGNMSLRGYLNFSMSFFNVSQFPDYAKPENPTKNVPYTLPYCRYPGYRQSHPPYSHRCEYFVILAVRLAFVFLFQWTITGVTRVLAWFISDVPSTVKLQKRREAHLTGEAVIRFKEMEGERKPRVQFLEPQIIPSNDTPVNTGRRSLKRFFSLPASEYLDS